MLQFRNRKPNWKRDVFAALLLTAIAILSFARASGAGEAAKTAIEASDLWARPSLGQSPNGVVYLTLTNRGLKADRLIGAHSKVAEKIGIHELVMSGNVMKMRPVSGGVPISARDIIQFKSGGLHLMLTGLKQKLKKGDHFRMVLMFEKAGKISVNVTVRWKAPRTNKTKTKLPSLPDSRNWGHVAPSGS